MSERIVLTSPEGCYKNERRRNSGTELIPRGIQREMPRHHEGRGGGHLRVLNAQLMVAQRGRKSAFWQRIQLIGMEYTHIEPKNIHRIPKSQKLLEGL